jgi:hypothetical protein
MQLAETFPSDSSEKLGFYKKLPLDKLEHLFYI